MPAIFGGWTFARAQPRHARESRVGFVTTNNRAPRQRLPSPPRSEPDPIPLPESQKPFNPPTVSETKTKFLKAYGKPIQSIYANVLQELLVQQHFDRFNANYCYDEALEASARAESVNGSAMAEKPVYALGVATVYDEIFESLGDREREGIFHASVVALNEDPARFRKKVLAEIADRAGRGSFHSTRFFSIGMFRLLERAGAREPAALAELVKSLSLRKEVVDKDLLLYKGILSKLEAAKELMAEIMQREQRKQAEREAMKAEEEVERAAGGDAAASSDGAVQA